MLGIELSSPGRETISPALDPSIIQWSLIGLVAEARVTDRLKSGGGSLLRLSMCLGTALLRVRFPESGGTETLSRDMTYQEERYLRMSSRGIKGFQMPIVDSTSNMSSSVTFNVFLQGLKIFVVEFVCSLG